MPAFNFKAQFVDPIYAGTKNHTIRAERRDGRVPAKVGDRLALYRGMRTKNCFLIKRVVCTRVEPISIQEPPYATPFGPFEIRVDEVLLTRDEKERLAYADGFDSHDRMMAFWEGRLPFKGYIIHWK